MDGTLLNKGDNIEKQGLHCFCCEGSTWIPYWQNCIKLMKTTGDFKLVSNVFKSFFFEQCAFGIKIS